VGYDSVHTIQCTRFSATTIQCTRFSAHGSVPVIEGTFQCPLFKIYDTYFYFLKSFNFYKIYPFRNVSNSD